MTTGGAAADALRVAVVCPHAWPPRDDVARHVRAEAAALARRGMRVTVLAPGADRGLVAEGRACLRRLATEGPGALTAAPGAPRELVVARALPAGRRRVGGPLDLADALHTALGAGGFDVVHLHEPLAPTPALAALRTAGCATVATLHRPESMAGAAFLRPLVQRAFDRLSLRIATGETVLRAAREVLPGEYSLVRPGVDPARFGDDPAPAGGPPGIVIVARSRERAGLRFALAAIRVMGVDALGPITVIGPGDAAWRTQRIVPKALRPFVSVVTDDGEDARAAALRAAGVALFPTPDEVVGPVLGEAMAAGVAVLAPRCAEVEGVLSHGRDGLVLPPFARTDWQSALAEMAADPGRRDRLAAAARARRRTWDAVAEDLESLYAIAIDRRRTRPDTAPAPVVADLRVRPPGTIDVSAWVRACRSAGLGVVAVASPAGLAPALAIAAAAPDDLAVVVGQEIATGDGAIVGLFLSREVASPTSLTDAIAEVRAQGGVVVVPHPDTLAIPPADALRRHADGIDCWEGLPPGAGRSGQLAADLGRRFGALVIAGSGASAPELVGTAWTELAPFQGPVDFLDMVAQARLHDRPQRRRARARAHAATGRGD